MRIKEQIAVGEDRRSQVILASVENQNPLRPINADIALRPAAPVVVKVYDPNFGEFDDDDWIGSRSKYFRRQWNTEVKAYIKLHSLSGVKLPIFYGEYVLGECFAIVLEYISQRSLSRYSVKSEQERGELEAAGNSLLVRLHAEGVCHGDIDGRNLLWNPSTRRLTAVDFEMAKFLDCCDDEQIVKNWKALDSSHMDGVFVDCGVREPGTMP